MSVQHSMEVRTDITVDVPIEDAFRVFTAQMGTWWPAGHTIVPAPANTVVEPEKGGRWYQQGNDGSQCTVGKVLEWDPPRLLRLAWQLTHEWQYDADFLTEVEVKFTEAGAGKTHVELCHQSLERYGDKAEQVREAIGSEGGWPLSLKEFSQAATKDSEAK